MGAEMGRVLVMALGAVALTGLVGCGSSSTTSTSTVASGVVTVQVTSPASGTVINANNVAVRGTVDPAGATVEIQGQPAAVGNGVFTANASLARGKTTIDVIGSLPGRTPGSTNVVITRAGQTGGGGSSRRSTGSGGNGATPSVANAAPGSQTGGRTSCGGGLSVGPDTSCSFAQNVESGYQANGPGPQTVYSPVTAQSYTMTCYANGGGEVVCTGGNNASVYFPG